jgi:hypothetical protein
MIHAASNDLSVRIVAKSSLVNMMSMLGHPRLLNILDTWPLHAW